VIVEHKTHTHADRARALEHLDGSLGYDAERYGELLLRAVEALLAPVGIRAETLAQWIAKELPAPRLCARLTAQTIQPDWGPLFEFGERAKQMRNARIISKKQNTRPSARVGEPGSQRIQIENLPTGFCGAGE